MQTRLPGAARTDGVPLSPGQERLWFLDQLTPGDASYNVYVSERLRGPLDSGALVRAFGEVVARHAVLRTRYPSQDGRPVQVAGPTVPGLRYVDLSDGPEERSWEPSGGPERRARDLVAELTNRGFDLAGGPVLRAALIRLATDDHVLCLVIHHIAVDGWSLGVLRAELAALYGAFAAGLPSPLPPPALQYADYALACRQDPGRDEDLAYWRTRLADPPVLALPTDLPRPRVRTANGAYVARRIPGPLAAEVARLARTERCTLFMTLTAAFQALLARHTGQDDVCVGTQVAARDRPELEGMVGFVVNTLVLRGDLSGDPSFRDLMRRTRATALEAYQRQSTPFDALVNELGIDRDLSRTPLFQAQLVLHNQAQAGPSLPGITTELFDGGFALAKFDLSLEIGQEEGELRAHFAYNSDLFERATIERLAARFEALLRCAVADPGTRLSELELLDADERRLILEHWSRPGPPGRAGAPDAPGAPDASGAPGGPAPAGDPGPSRDPGPLQGAGPSRDGGPFRGVATLHGLVERAAARTPEAVAVVFGDDALTYRELNARADRLAAVLRDHGTGPDRRVAICLEQSLDLAVAVPAVLKAGGAYVPLDPEQPADRLAHMVADSGAEVLVTTRALAGRVSAGITVLLGEGDEEEVSTVLLDGREEIRGLLPSREAGPDDLAYVIYTSGSTGRPKGVAIQHRQVLNYLADAHERFEVVDGAGYALLQSLSFDFGITIFYLALATGGRLHLVPSRISGPDLADYADRARIDYLKITPSHLGALTAEVDPRRLLPRRVLILGGEGSAWEWTRELAALGVCRVVNHYGPTEATVGVTTYEVGADDDVRGPVTPIGRPLGHARAYVLDGRMRPAPIGVIGELCLGGDRLAREYLGRPDLTAEKFLPDPYGEPGDRLYRTGDLARWLPDGNLEFLGRRDLQVKVRGYRVELGEVDEALRTLPGVAHAVVDARGGPGALELVAYLVAADGPAARPGVGELRRLLQAVLPDYMVPTRYVWLDRLPLKSHGKVDRAALPEPETARPDREAAFEAPSGMVEEAVASAFAEVLGLDRVGATDDFFDLGGHSLLAVQVVARLRRRLDGMRPVSVMDLFQHPTARGLATLVEAGDDGPRGLLYELTPRIAAPELTLVCVPYGGGSAVVYQPLADALPAGCALHAVAVPGHDLGLAEEPRPLAEVAAECAAEILRKVTGPLVLYGHCGVGGALTVEIARQVEAAGRPLDAVYLGGLFPFARPTRGVLGRWARFTGLERLRGDRGQVNWLTGMGADLSGLTEEQLAFVVRNMRHDSRQAEEYFTRLVEEGAEPLSAPIISVVGERDPNTEFHAERYTEWDFLSPRTALAVLDEGGHYFLKYRAEELAEIVTTVHPALAAPAVPEPATPTWRVAGRSDSSVPVERGTAAPEPSLGRFLAVAIGQFVTIVGATLTEFAIPISTYLDSRSLTQFAVLQVLALIPGILVAPLAGAVVDRASRRTVMLGGNIAALVVQLLTGTLLWTGELAVWHLYPLLTALSIALTFQRLAYVSAVPQLVPKRYLGHANGVVQMTTGVAQFVAPLVAVGLLAAIGLEGILALDVAGYVAGVIVLLCVGFPARLAGERRESVGAEIAGGFRLQMGQRGFRAMLVFFALFNLVLSPVFLLFSPLTLSFGTLADAGYVALLGGAGAVTGGLVMSVWGGPAHRRMHGVLLGTLALAACCLVTGAHGSLLFVGLGAFGVACSLALVNGVYATIVQVKVAQRFHGRVFALNQMVALSTIPLGVAVIAPLGERLLEPMFLPGGLLAGTAGAVIGVGPGRGIAFMYVVCGLLVALIALVALRSRTLSRFDDEVPDAVADDLIGIQALNDRTGTTERKEAVPCP
ncbi:non-ribosomal peptide synthetase/MFS transporter [Streptosporangium roseum]|uniref:non-ribosomal peptide synthetase/MFS transporter n=1 Tax=Streptosporangium roseum TaxID=2001 RepID=UPI0033303BF8